MKKRGSRPKTHVHIVLCEDSDGAKIKGVYLKAERAYNHAALLHGAWVMEFSIRDSVRYEALRDFYLK